MQWVNLATLAATLLTVGASWGDTRARLTVLEGRDVIGPHAAQQSLIDKYQDAEISRIRRELQEIERDLGGRGHP